MAETQNIEVVNKLYACFLKGDIPGVLATLDENIDWTFNGRSSDVPFAGHYQGQAGMINFFTTVGQSVEKIEAFGPTEIRAFEDMVVSFGEEKVVAITGKTFETAWVHIFNLHNGKIVRLREYYDTARIAEAFRK